MVRALITGATGFTGRHLAQKLSAEGVEVFGFGDEDLPGRAKCLPVNLLDAESMQRAFLDIAPEVIYHLAAVSFVAHSDVGEIYQTNIVGTRNLLVAASKLGSTLQHAIIASSANVYGNSTHEVLSEAEPALPANDYALSKLGVEHLARIWSDRLPLTIVRPFNYTGRGQSVRFVIPKIVQHFVDRKSTISLGNIDVVRDFSDVRDVVEAYLRLSHLPPRAETYNICSGTGHSLRDLIDRLRTMSGHDIDVQIDASLLRAGEIARLIGDRSKLDAVTGNLPIISISDTLEWMLKSEAQAS